MRRMGSAEDTLERGVKENDDFSSGSSQTTPQLPNVPLEIDYAKTMEARLLVKVRLHDMGKAAQVYTLPPGHLRALAHFTKGVSGSTQRP